MWLRMDSPHFDNSVYSPVAQLVERLTVNEAVTCVGDGRRKSHGRIDPERGPLKAGRVEGLNGSFLAKAGLKLRVNSGKPNPREGHGNPEPSPVPDTVQGRCRD